MFIFLKIRFKLGEYINCDQTRSLINFVRIVMTLFSPILVLWYVFLVFIQLHEGGVFGGWILVSYFYFTEIEIYEWLILKENDLTVMLMKYGLEWLVVPLLTIN